MGSKNEKLSHHKLYSFHARRIKCLFKESKSNCLKPKPKGRSGHRISANRAFIYTFGGYNPLSGVDVDNDYMLVEHRLFKEIWRFNIITKEWVKLDFRKEDFPAELASMTLQTIGNHMVIHGGTGIPFGVASSNVTYLARFPNCDLKKLETTGALPLPMYGQASAIDEKAKLLYIVGGTSGLTFSMDLHFLDLGSGLWTKIKPNNAEEPAARYRHEIALHDDKIIVFGGGTIENTFDFQSLPVFDLATQCWSRMWTKGYRRSRTAQPKFPKPRRCHSGLLVPAEEGSDAEYVICGGFDGDTPFADVWSLNLRTRQWLQWKSSLPHKVYFHDAALTPQGRMVIFGGIVDNTTFEDENEVARTNEVLACWVKIPKLSEMAWEAVMHYTPTLPKMTAPMMLSLGIPLSFVQRVC